MTTLTVGAGQQYTTIADAVRNTRDGDTVLVRAGTYVDDAFTVTHKITLKSVGGRAIIAGTKEPSNGKGLIVADADLTIEGFGFTGSRVGDGNGAGIRYDLGNLVVRDCVFWDNQDGILANGWADGTILIENSEFSHNGAGDGLTHNLYIGAIASLTVRDSYFHDSVVGHEIKSRARNTTLLNNRIQDNTGNGSYSIDIPDGGLATIMGNVIEKGPDTENWIAIHYGGEGTSYPNSALNIVDNTIINDNPNGYLIVNAATNGSAVLTGNRLWGWAANHISLGSVVQAGNTVLSQRPSLDLTSKAPAVAPRSADPVFTPVPEDTFLQDWGDQGVVAPTGRVLTVGPTGRFSTLSAALASARDGDTIKVAAGTYVNDFGTVSKKVIIEGVGGIARFVQSNMLDASNGILVITTDATLRNLEFTGATNYGGHEGGILVKGGRVTIVNSWFHGNDIGILADDNPNTAILIVDSEIGPNGNEAKGTHNLTIGAIGSLVIRRSSIHGATSGHEISLRAYNALIEDNAIWDGPGVQASFLVNIGQGGNVTLRNNLLEKGPDAENGLLVHVGGEGPAYGNSDVELIGNAFVTRLYNPGHPYTYFVVGDDGSGAVPPVTALANRFYGGVPGSQAYIGVGATAATVPLAGAPVLDTTPPWSAALAPPLFSPVSPGPNTLTLRLAQQKGDLDVAFTVTIDGAIAGSGVVTTLVGAGTQTFTFTGWWGNGAHAVTIATTNIVYRQGPTAGALFIGSAQLDNVPVAPSVTLDYSRTTWSGTLFSTSKFPDFDPVFYLAQNADVRAAGIDPLQHWTTWGLREGRNPNAWFDTRWYLSQNPDVAASGINPLQHFEQTGWAQGRDPSPRFSVADYLAQNPDVRAAGIDPLQHYLETGRAQGRAIQPAIDHASVVNELVDSAWYFARHPDAAASGMTAAAHYKTTGWTLRYDPNPWFDTTFYQLQNPGLYAAGMDPLTHFEAVGWRTGQDPSPWFSVKAWQAAHPTAFGTNPLSAFLASNEDPPTARLNLYSNPEAALFDAAYYVARNPDVPANHFDPLTHYETLGWREDRNPSAFFDTAYYLNRYPDVAASGVDPLLHYATIGWIEGRDPSPLFSTSAYLTANADVRDSGINPLQHYIQTGRDQGRAIEPATGFDDPLVDSAWYFAQHPDAAASGLDAATHYHTIGWTLRYDPNPWFDTTYYQLENPEVASRKIDPLLHFENLGWTRGRDPSPWFSLSRYQAAHPDTTGTDPLLSFIRGTEDAATPVHAAHAYSTPEAALFDAAYYNARNPDVAANFFDALTHYETLGWREGRDPSANFSTNKYFAAYSDVRAANIDPLAHFASVGSQQGRIAFAV